MGRKPKKTEAVVKVAEALGITLAADVMSIEEMQDFPTLRDESVRNQGIMACIACGFPQSHVAEMFGVKQPTIHEIIHRIDPGGRFRLSPNAKKAFVTQMAEGRAMSAINSITFDELLECTPVERTKIATEMTKIAQSLNQSKHKEIGASRLDSLMDEVIEAERVEVSASPLASPCGLTTNKGE
jgi:hypothetical protein